MFVWDNGLVPGALDSQSLDLASVLQMEVCLSILFLYTCVIKNACKYSVPGIGRANIQKSVKVIG